MDFEYSINGIKPVPFVNGKWLGDNSLSGATFSKFDPSTGEVFTEINNLCRPYVANMAMECAYSTWSSWKKVSLDKRRELLLTLANMLEKNRQKIVFTIQKETGILNSRANEEVTHGVELLREVANLPELNYEERLNGAAVEINSFGVVVWIMSWNSPIASLCKIAYPLLMGNTIVLKVSPFAIICAFLFAEAVCEASFPDGVINIVWDQHGDIATDLVSHKFLGKCAFTGNILTAKKILQNISYSSIRPTFFETGGGGVQVILEDADLDTVLPHVFWGAFTLSGQICCAGTKIFVHESIFEKVVSELSSWLQSIKIGTAHDKNTELGPVISQIEVDRVNNLVKRSINAGAMMVANDQKLPQAGFFVKPQIIITDDIKNPILNEEIFGPIAAVVQYKERTEVVAMLNQLNTGLTLGIYTKDIAWVCENMKDLIYGTVWINGYYQSSIKMPFGGTKDSGYGRERGIAGLREFSQEKVIVFG